MNNGLNNYGTVDERIVEMRIDNTQFENGAKKTISLLEKLDKALHLHAETDEIDKLTNAVGKFDVSPMANGLDTLQRHFSALEIVGMRVISNLTDSVYNFTARTIKSLSVDQVTAGWSKYEQKTSAVQTIMAATRKDIGTLYADEAEQMEAVNAQLEKLNWFTDETSYSFLDMVNNIGKFTSNGRALDESVTAMMGISTWAAISGAKVQEASRAMYNLSQALGTGSVQVRDWMSIENANMATYEFKQMAIETAEALGTLKKRSDGVWESLAGHEVTVESFRENLKDDWFTSDVLLETLQNYGTFTEALKIATEETDTTATEFLRAMRRFEEGENVDEDLIPWIQELSQAQYELGRRAFQAAQEAKTFTEAIDATKDAVSTGWMNSFEKIFGDYQTAKTFWTDIANDLWEIFAGGGESRNSMLDVAFGKVTDVIDDNETVKEAKNAWSEFEEQLNDAGLSMDDFRASYEKVIEASDDDALKKLVDEGNSIEDVFRRGAISGKTFKDILDDLTGKAKETAKTTDSIDLSSNMDTKLAEYRALIPKIIRGDFGNGEERKAALEALGYNYKIAQKLAEWSYLGYSTELEQLAQEFPTLVEMMRDEMVANGTITEEELTRVNLLLNDTDATLAKLQNATGTMTDKTVNGTQRAIDRGELFRKGLVNILDTIVLVKNIVNEAFENVFGTAEERGEVLGKLIERFYDITEYVKESNNKASDTRKGLVRIFEVIFRIAHLITRVIGLGFKLVNQIIGVSYRFIEKILAAIGRTRKETEEIGRASIFDILESALDTIEAISLSVTSILHSILDSNITQTIFSALTFGIAKITEWLSVAKGYAKTIIDFLEPAVGLLLMALAGITSFAASHVFTAITAVFNAIASLPSSIVNFVSSSQLLSSIWSGISETLDKIKRNLQKGWEFVRGIFENRGFTEALKGLRAWASDMLGKIFPNLVSAFENFNIKLTGEGNIFQSILTGITNGLIGIGGLFIVVFSGLLKLITGLLNGLQGVNFNTDKIAEGFNNFYEIIKLIFNGLFGDPTELKERVTNFVLEVWSGFKDAINQISIWDAIKALRLASLLAIIVKISNVLGSIKRVSYEVASIPESITRAIGKGSMMFDDIGKSFRANAMIKLAISLILVATALYGLSRIDEQKLTQAAAVASLIMVVLAIIVNSFSKARSLQNINIHHNLQIFNGLGSALLGLGIAVAVITFSIIQLEKIAGSENFTKAAIIVGAILGILTVIVAAFIQGILKTKTYSEGLKAVGRLISKLSGTMLIMSLAVGNLVLPILAFTAVAAFLEKKGLASDHVWHAAIAIIGILGILGLVIRAILVSISKISEGQLQYIGSTMLKIAASMYVFAMALGRFMRPFFLLAIVSALIYNGTEESLEPIWTALEVVTGLLFMLGVFIAGMTFMLSRLSDRKIAEIGSSMLKIGASVILLGSGIKKLVFAMVEIMAVISILKYFGAENATIGNIIDMALNAMLKIATGLVVVLAVLATISSIPGLNLKNLLGIAAIITALGIAFLFISPILITLSIGIGILATALSKMTNSKEIIQRIKDMISALFWIAAASLAFGGAILIIGTGAIKIALALGILALAFLAVAGGLALISKNQAGVINFFKKIRDFFKFQNLGNILQFIAVLGICVTLALVFSRTIKEIARMLNLYGRHSLITHNLKKSFGSIGDTLLGTLKRGFIATQAFLTDPKNISTITQSLSALLVTVGLYLAGVIPTFTETVVTSLITLVTSLSESIQRHRAEFSAAIADAINTLFAIVGDVIREVFFNGDAWKEGGIGGGILRILAGTFIIAKIAKAITSIINLFGRIVGFSFGGKVAKGIVEGVDQGDYIGKHLKKSAEAAGATAGAAAKAGFLSTFGTIAGLISTELAVVGGATWLRHASDKDAAETGLNNVVNALQNSGLNEVDAYVKTIDDLLHARTLITNVSDEDMDEADVDKALRRNNEAIAIAYENLAKALGISRSELDKMIVTYGNVSKAVEEYRKQAQETVQVEKDISASIDVAVQDNKATEAIAQAKTDLFQALSTGDFKSLFDSFITTISPDASDASSISAKYSDFAKYIPEGAKQGVLDNLTTFTDALTKMGFDGMDIFKWVNQIASPSETYAEIAKWIPEGVAAGIRNNMQVAYNASLTLAKYVSKGAIIGIRNNLQAAYNAGVALANAVNEGYRRTLKINSPSKVFEAMSRFIPEGVAVGINNNQEPAITAIVGLGKAVIEAAHRTMAQVSYVASDDFNFQPSITPVVDFGEIRAGASNLSSIFSRNATDVNVRPHGRYSDVNMPETAMSYTMTNQNRDVVNEIHRLSDLMSQLGEEITNMKIVLNSGVLVGEMAPQMNNRLGILAQRERRQ